VSALISEGFILKEKVAELANLILSKHPKMPVLLREIHTMIRMQPEQVTLIDEEEINIIVSGLKVQTQTQFVQAAIKGTGSKSAVSKIKAGGADLF